MCFEERVAWILNLIKEKEKLNNTRLGQILGVNKNTIQAYTKKKGDLKGVALAAIVKKFGINGEWLIAGQGEPFPGARIKHPEACGPETELVADQPEGAEAGKFVLISQVNGRISAGMGLIPDDSVDIKIAFRRDWIKKKGNPENMSLIKVSGDSMQPALLSGDIALVDHGHNYIDPQGGIYAIAVDGEIMIKRVQPIPGGKILVISDNKRYTPLEIAAEHIRVNGKVIWYARELER